MGYERGQNLSEKRQRTPCKFDDGISYHEFEQIAKKAAEKFPRIKQVTVGNAEIYCTVESITGYTDWYFRVNFNDWGHITGTRWSYTSNSDSNLHKAFGEEVAREVCKILKNKGISLPDYCGIVNEDDKVGTADGLSYEAEESLWEKLFAKRRQIGFEYSSKKLTGEHVYYVVALLKRWGFKNIESRCIKDIGKNSNKYIYEVDHISVEDKTHIRKGDVFASNAEIVVYYHEKQEIKMPYSAKHYKHKNYVSVGDEFVNMGFSKIYERKIEDLITGWITKDGSVEDVFVKLDNVEIQLKKGQLYEFDTPIIITYHTFKYL